MCCCWFGWVFSLPSLEVIYYFSTRESHQTTASQKQFKRQHKPMEISPELVCSFYLISQVWQDKEPAEWPWNGSVPQASQGALYTPPEGEIHNPHSNHLQQVHLLLDCDHYSKSSWGTEEELEEAKAQRYSTKHMRRNSIISLFHEEMLQQLFLVIHKIIWDLW